VAQFSLRARASENDMQSTGFSSAYSIWEKQESKHTGDRMIQLYLLPAADEAKALNSSEEVQLRSVTKKNK
jgi:hypothetical protein